MLLVKNIVSLEVPHTIPCVQNGWDGGRESTRTEAHGEQKTEKTLLQ